MPDPQAYGRQCDGGEIVSREFVEAGCDSSEVFQLVEKPLDEVALTVDFGVDGAANPDVALARDVGGGAAGLDEFNDGAREVAPVGDKVAPQFEPGEQRWRRRLVGGLTRGEEQAHRQAATVDDGVDLGAQSAARSSDGVIRAPFFPPAAC